MRIFFKEGRNPRNASLQTGEQLQSLSPWCFVREPVAEICSELNNEVNIRILDWLTNSATSLNLNPTNHFLPGSPNQQSLSPYHTSPANRIQHNHERSQQLNEGPSSLFPLSPVTAQLQHQIMSCTPVRVGTSCAPIAPQSSCQDNASRRVIEQRSTYEHVANRREPTCPAVRLSSRRESPEPILVSANQTRPIGTPKPICSASSRPSLAFACNPESVVQLEPFCDATNVPPCSSRKKVTSDKPAQRRAAKYKHKAMTAIERQNKHTLLKPCKCRRLCFLKVDQQTRQDINRAFWARSFSGRRSFLDKHVQSVFARPCSKPNRIRLNINKRKYSLEYSLPTDESERERVCKVMFLHTIGVKTDGLVTKFLGAKRTRGTEPSLADGRTRSRVHSRWQEDLIKRHINSFHPQISHYRLLHAPKRRYLDGALTVRKLWRDFTRKHGVVSYAKYWAVFNKENISFGQPKTDLCDMCNQAKEHAAEQGAHSLAECQMCWGSAMHKGHAAIARQHYMDDANAKWPPATAVFAVDMQKVLLLPMMRSKRAFFTKRLVCFNETFASLCGAQHFCLLWHEAVAGRVAAEVASSFASLIERCTGVFSDFIFWADNCSAQNKNWVLFSTFLQLVHSASGPRTITLKYLEPGHTYMRADSIHGLIAKHLKRNPTVLTFPDLATEIAASCNGLSSVPMNHAMFRDWTSLKDPKYNGPKMREFREVQFRQGDRRIYYKLRLEATAYRSTLFISLDKVPSLPAPRQAMRGLNSTKKKALVSALCPLMPTVKRKFWVDLPQCEGADLGTEFEWDAAHRFFEELAST